jgi:hypothetical protein
MHVRISQPELLSDLVAALTRAQCPVRRVNEDGIEIDSPSPLLTDEQARNEIGLYLVLWRSKHPGVRLTIDD